MVPGHCVPLGSPRRLSLHSIASCYYSFRAPFAPCRAPHADQSCNRPAREAGAVLPDASNGRGAGASACCSVAAGAANTGDAIARAATRSGTRNGEGAETGSPSASAGDRRGSSSSSVVGSSGRSSTGGGRASAAVAGVKQGSLVEDTTAENWLTPLRRPGSVVALGKFDALHRGHCALAAVAASLAREIHAVQSGDGAEPSPTVTPAAGAGAAIDAAGDAVLLSFSGMGAVLGWPNRLPLTSPQDRGRVLAGWAAACSGNCNGVGAHQYAASPAGTSDVVVTGDADQADAGADAAVAAPPPPRLRTMPFSLIRGMAPEQFVALLARDLGAAGVVAGRNYRFGYKAAGDADTLVRLGRQYGMRVEIVDLVTLPDQATTATTATGTATGNESVGGSKGSSNGAAGIDRSRGSNSRGSSSVCTTASAPLDATRGRAGDGGSMAAVASSSDGAASTATVVASQEGPGKAAGSSSSRNGGGVGGGCGADAAVAHSSRVSSSRIRELLESGQVGSVEQLLGRKYRLVCDLAAATASTTASTGSNCGSGGGNSSSSSNGAVGLYGGDPAGGRAAGGEARLVLPHGSYQNQPPASGRYRALVQLVTSSRAPTGPGVGCDGAGRLFGAGVGGDNGGMDAGWVQVSGGACVIVELGESGLEVELGDTGLQYMANKDDGGLLLVDFDACG